MNGKARSRVSILAGAGVALGLIVLNWLLVGRFYASSFDYDFLLEVGLLFWGALLPATAIAAFAAGVTEVMISGRSKSARPAVAVILAAYVFALGLQALHPNANHTLLASLRPYSIPVAILLFLAQFPVMLLFVCIGSFVFCICARIGAMLASSPRIRGRTAVWLLAVSVLASLAVATVQASMVQAEMRASRELVPVVTADINRNLVRIPSDTPVRVSLGSSFVPKVKSVRFQLPGGTAAAIIARDGSIKERVAWFEAPRGAYPSTKDEAASILAKRGVRQPVLKKLKNAPGGGWIVDNGHYGVMLNQFDPTD